MFRRMLYDTVLLAWALLAVGFLDFVVLPLFRSFVSRFKPATPLLQAVLSNKSHWMARDLVRLQVDGRDRSSALSLG